MNWNNFPSFKDLIFEREIVYFIDQIYNWHTQKPTGQFFKNWRWVKVPRISDEVLKCCVYLDEVRENNDLPEPVKATGFLVGIPTYIPDCIHTYIITAAHYIQECPHDKIAVSWNDEQGAVSVRIARKDWVLHRTADIAATPFDVSRQLMKSRCLFVDTSQFITDKTITQYDIGIGDETFEIGRLNQREGEQYISPSIRFGNICMMENDQSDDFLVELHSGSGYSGSPVFVYRFPVQTIPFSPGEWGSIDNEPIVPFLLGIHGSHYDIDDTLRRIDDLKQDAPGQEHLRSVSHSGISCVVPAWKLRELLKKDELIKDRKQRETYWLEENKRHPHGAPVTQIRRKQTKNIYQHDFENNEFHNPFDLEVNENK